jgi:hypothetical protein
MAPAGTAGALAVAMASPASDRGCDGAGSTLPSAARAGPIGWLEAAASGGVTTRSAPSVAAGRVDALVVGFSALLPAD